MDVLMRTLFVVFCAHYQLSIRHQTLQYVSMRYRHHYYDMAINCSVSVDSFPVVLRLAAPSAWTSSAASRPSSPPRCSAPAAAAAASPAAASAGGRGPGAGAAGPRDPASIDGIPVSQARDRQKHNAKKAEQKRPTPPKRKREEKLCWI